MKTIFESKVLNDYRSKKPRGFYHRIKGHTGVDLNYINENLPSPITGEVVAITHQNEMGNVLYIKDVKGNIHVFAHLSKISPILHQKVNRGDMIAITGNTGARTTAPHLHYEIICTGPKTSPFDYIMTRSLAGFNGYNRNPIKYLIELYEEYKVPTK
jgi:murein DD-endopeptidase MepM/ murein hydrolase activator NlpD